MNQSEFSLARRVVRASAALLALAQLAGCISQETHEHALQNAQRVQDEAARREQASLEIQRQLTQMNATLIQTLQQQVETQRALSAELARVREAGMTAQAARQADAQERIQQLELLNQQTEARAQTLEGEVLRLKGGLHRLRARGGQTVELDASSPWR